MTPEAEATRAAYQRERLEQTLQAQRDVFQREYREGGIIFAELLSYHQLYASEQSAPDELET